MANEKKRLRIPRQQEEHPASVRPRRRQEGGHAKVKAQTAERVSPTRAHGTLGGMMLSLQHGAGNAYVQRVVAHLQRSSKGELKPDDVEQTVENLENEKGSGHAMDEGTQKEMEGVLGHDLSGVRLHTDEAANKAAADLNAAAFTMGSDVYFGQGRGNSLSSTSGKKLLAHELTHVVQQNQGGLSLPGGNVKMGNPGDAYEAQADTVANQVSQAPGVQRQEEEELLQAKDLQRQEEEEEEEELLQAKDLQRQEEEEELLM